MKIKQQEQNFKQITITIETEQEKKAFHRIIRDRLNRAVINGTEDKNVHDLCVQFDEWFSK